MVVIRIGTRLAVTIDSLNSGCTHVYCQVYVDDPTGLVAANQLYNSDFTTVAAQLAASDCLVGTKEAIFNLLKNGAAHTFYFFFWVDAGNGVLSLVQLWEAVGVSGTIARAFLQLNYKGATETTVETLKIGSGTAAGYLWFMPGGVATDANATLANYAIARTIVPASLRYYCKSTTTTDLAYFSFFIVNLQS